jgi:hypothetical protein
MGRFQLSSKGTGDERRCKDENKEVDNGRGKSGTINDF